MKVGIDIGGTETKVVLCDDELNVLEKNVLKTPHFQSEADFLSFIFSLVKSKNVDTLNLSLAGFVNQKGGGLEFSPNLNLKISDLVGKLRRKFSGKVFIENDVNCAALYLLKEYGIGNFVVLMVGTGLGSGVVCNGKLIRGGDGFGTEAGHMNYVEDGVLCGCGRRGCYEGYCSGIAFKRLKESGLDEDKIEKIMAEALFHLIYNLTSLLNPEVFFLGGGVIWNLSLFERVLDVFLKRGVLFSTKLEKLKENKFISALGSIFLEESLKC